MFVVLNKTKRQKGKAKGGHVAVEPPLDTTTLQPTNTMHAHSNVIDPTPGPSSPSSSSRSPIPPHLASESPSIQHRVRSRPTSRDVSPYPRSRPSTPNRLSTSSPSVQGPVAPRRSQRTLAKGPERPSGPPELEAALAIAIRNLESDIYAWWCANQKPGSPIPTTAYLKGRSPRIRKAAEAVDEADRLLNEAVYGKPKKTRTLKRVRVSPKASPDSSGDVTPETTFEQLELDSQGSTTLRQAAVTPNISN
jgi:hypothetical protein